MSTGSGSRGRRGLAAVFVSLAGLAVGAGAPAKPVVTPVWIQIPISEQISKAYDASRCSRTRIPYPGSAVVGCDLTREGRLANCAVISEKPAHCAYGQAALRLAPYFRAGDRLKDGRRIPNGARVRVPIRFAFPTD